jgi:hypothetical protein
LVGMCRPQSYPIPSRTVSTLRHAEGAKRPLDHCRIEPADDEYQTRASVRIGPGLQVPRRMHQMLHGMHRYWRRRVGDIEDALYPQQRVAMAVEQHCQPDAEPRPINGLVGTGRQGTEIVGMSMMIVGHSIAGIRRLPAFVGSG